MPIITCPFPAIVIVIDSAICNKPSALNCQHRLLSQLNGPSTADMSDAIQLRTFLLDQMSISADRMARICTAISDMFMCFGSIQLDACLNADALIGDRVLNVTQAYAWSSTIAQIRFSCGAGFDAIQSQYECFARVMRLQNATLARCWSDFEANIAHSDPSALCSYVNAEMNCYMQPFAVCNRRLQWWSCESQRQYLLIRYYNCETDPCTAMMLTDR